LLRRLITAFSVVFALIIGVSFWVTGDSTSARAQSRPSNNSNQNPNPQATPKPDKNSKNYTAEQIAETSILVYGSRPILAQIRRNGVERGRVCKPTCETPGKTEEATYERRFVRGEKSDKDKVRVDQKMPTLEYSLIYGGGRLWGLINGTAFTPREDAANTFLSQHRHSLDTLLRYKENGSTLAMIGKDKQKGLDLYILDLTDAEKQKTRYFISAKTFHVVWLEYEESTPAGQLVKFRRSFHDYRYAQGTLVPYKTVLLQDGSQTQETKILTVTFGIKLDDDLFKSPEA
jgi:hypothetical protein